MSTLREIPAHVWLFGALTLLMVGYYVRPDEVTHDLVKTFAGALLLCLRAERPSA